MVANSNDAWIGVEYFCNDTDPLWQANDQEAINAVISEMESIGVLQRSQVKDATIIRVKNAYPSYFGAYENFGMIREWLDTITNLYPIGRNGMHRYNNSDHSMLTAMAAVENIVAGKLDKTNIWNINTEDEYHEESTK